VPVSLPTEFAIVGSDTHISDAKGGRDCRNRPRLAELNVTITVVHHVVILQRLSAGVRDRLHPRVAFEPFQP
jgi:hypothetical protein